MWNEAAPAPNVPGNTDAERMDNALRKVLTFSKADSLKEEAKWKRARKKRPNQKGHSMGHSDKEVRVAIRHAGQPCHADSRLPARRIDLPTMPLRLLAPEPSSATISTCSPRIP
jgi:hypothetical protein